LLGADGGPLLAQRGRSAVEDVAILTHGRPQAGGLALLHQPLRAFGTALLTLGASHVALRANDMALRSRLMTLDAGSLPFNVRGSALRPRLLALGTSNVALRAGGVPLGADLLSVGSRLMALCRSLVVGCAVRPHLLVGGRSFGTRLRVAAVALTVPAALRRAGGRREQREAQKKRSVSSAFHGAPPRRPRGGFKGVASVGRVRGPLLGRAIDIPSRRRHHRST
jgi:hypothetical protein